MALVAKSNQTRNTVAVVILLAVAVGGTLFLLRDRLFPPSVPTLGDGTVNAGVPTLPVYPDTGAAALNTNSARALAPHGDATLKPCPGRDNPFEPIEGSQGCP